MSEKEYILRIIDFETTGIPEHGVEHSVVEVALVDKRARDRQHVTCQSRLVCPTTPMDICSLAVHHITEEEARKGVSWEKAQECLLYHNKDEVIIYVAHNAKFEQQFFNPEGSLWIDTYKVALKLYQDAPKHSNQVLKYYLGIPDDNKFYPPHRALPDCFVTAEILMRMAEKLSFNDMIKISKEPPYYTTLTFGKHKGLKYEDAPFDYLQWIIKQNNMDDGVISAAKRALSRFD